jgi:UTP--glucose-1-phosphate uridylyltransferase
VSEQVRKAVIPAAGLGTRFLPATKALPKEMLPVIDRPAIDYVVAEAAAAGLDDVLLITSRSKRAIVDHFDESPELERALASKGDETKLAAVRASSRMARVHTVRQQSPAGLGHAVLCAADHVGSEPFAVLLGDDLVDPRDPLLSIMLKVREAHGGSVVALMRVPDEQVSMYGVAAVAPVTDAIAGELRITGLVEKPALADAPSNLIVIGRYVLSPTVFSVLRNTPPGRNGEIQLTDALQTLAAMPDSAGEAVHGLVFDGRRYDTGDKQDFLRTQVRLAVERADVGPEFSEWLRTFVAEMPAEPWKS